MPDRRDLRGWDAVVVAEGWADPVEAETRPTDLQALQRRVALKQRDSGFTGGHPASAGLTPQSQSGSRVSRSNIGGVSRPGPAGIGAIGRGRRSTWEFACLALAGWPLHRAHSRHAHGAARPAVGHSFAAHAQIRRQERWLRATASIACFRCMALTLGERMTLIMCVWRKGMSALCMQRKLPISGFAWAGRPSDALPALPTPLSIPAAAVRRSCDGGPLGPHNRRDPDGKPQPHRPCRGRRS